MLPVSRRFRQLILGISLVGVHAQWCRAVGPVGPPTVESVVPAAGGRGTSFTILLTGGKLGTQPEVLLYRQGLRIDRVEVMSDNEARLHITASREAPLGAYPFRIRTSGGLSELRLIHVAASAATAEVEPNDATADLAITAIPATITGVIDAADVDSFGIRLTKGERLSAELEAIRLGGEMTDAVLTIQGPDGRTIVEVDDTAATRQDPFASIVAQSDGLHFVRVREAGYGGGPSNTYVLHLGSFARPTYLFPPGGEAGTKLELVGADAAGGRLVETIELPRNSGPWWDHHPSIAGVRAPTPTPLRVRPYPSVGESSSEASAWPVAFHGVLSRPGEFDVHRVRLSAGDEIQAEVFAARIGSRLDSLLEVLDPEGSPLARNDDEEDGEDSRIGFRAAVDGDHRVVIRDKRGDGGPGFFYRIEVEKPLPRLRLFLAGPVRKSQNRQVIAVPRGNRVLVHIGVRRERFSGPVRLDWKGVPAGVRLDHSEIQESEYLVPVVVEAAADAPLGATLATLQGVASTIDGTVRGGFEQVVDLVPGSGDSSYQSVTVDRVALVVTDPAPYRVELSRPSGPLTRDGELTLTAKVERSSGFDGPVEVSLPYLPSGVEMDGPATIAEGETEASLRLFARPDADTSAWRLTAEARPAPPRRDRREMTLAIMAQIGAGGTGRPLSASTEGSATVASGFVPLDLVEAVVAGRIATISAEQGSETMIECVLEPGSPFLARAEAVLEGLPPRVETVPVAVEPGDKSVRFRLRIDRTAPLGDHSALVCRLRGDVGGRPATYRVGRGGRLVIGLPGSTTGAADGRPLSPLDALRRRAGADAAPSGTTSAPSNIPVDTKSADPRS